MNYIALTIGPIIETLSNSRKTREVWVSSYFFSYYMQSILKELEEEFEFLTPTNEKIKEIKLGRVGLFHDRFMAKSKKSFEDIETLLDKAIENAINKMANFINNKNRDVNKNEKFLKEYLQNNYIMVEAKDIKGNPILELNKYLDTMELQRSFISNSEDNYSKISIYDKKNRNRRYYVNPIEYLKYEINSTDLKKNAFKEKDSFLSFAEIASKELLELELSQNEKETLLYDEKLQDDDNEFYKKLKEALEKIGKKELFKNYHKYVAIIQADGDRVGKLLEEIGSKTDKIKEFSNKLMEFAEEVPKISLKYGAEVVYAGGDDILAFAPVIYNNQTFFDYLNELNSTFKKIFKELELKEEAKSVSLSFGVNVIYHKFPLYEGLELARNNLFGVAKQIKSKNIITVEHIKNSGQSAKNSYHQNSDLYIKFNELLKAVLTAKVELPHSIHHNLQKLEKIIISLKDKEDFSERLENLFDNSFNENDHKGKFKDGLDLVRKLLEEYFKNYEDEKIFKEFFDSLHIIKHLRGDR